MRGILEMGVRRERINELIFPPKADPPLAEHFNLNCIVRPRGIEPRS